MRTTSLLFFLPLFCLLSLVARAEEETPSQTMGRLQVECACLAFPLEQQWAQASAVFSGTIEEIKTVEKYYDINITDPAVEVILRVDKAFKGEDAKEGETFTLFTNIARKTCCGHPFVQDEKYLVFAYLRETYQYRPWSLYNFPSGTYDVGGLCGGTMLLKDAEDVLPKIKKLSAQYAAENKKSPLDELKDKIFK